jgi:hypothetical protein
VRALRGRGYSDAYLAALDPKWHEAIATLTAATWLPIELAMAHYQACDSLGLSRATIESIGGESGLFVNQTVLRVVANASKAAGVTPFFALGQANTLLVRTWVGTSMAVWRLGPKEARLDWVQQPLMRYPYFRTAFGAFTAAICALFAMTLYAREMPARTKDDEASYRISWV